MTTIAKTLDVARSNLIERVSKKRPKRTTYDKADDVRLVPMIRELVDLRPTYGYRRITALLNRKLVATGESRVNHKRIYRIMELHGWLLQPHTGRRIERAHDGKVRTLSSNMRWCSDGFEIPCWNGEIVRVAFTLDTCDREAITWTATTAGISGEMVRDMMLIAVERRFGDYHAPHRVEYLADNGSCYTAYETVDFAISLGLMPLFTPIRSPESNGMAESFVKTFKRDYVRCNPRPDAITVLNCLDSWFEDYNSSHPHRALKMLSPREFIQANLSLAVCPV
jgi:putative transposase